MKKALFVITFCFLSLSLFAQEEANLNGAWEYDYFGIVDVFAFHGDGTGVWSCEKYDSRLAFTYTFDGLILQVTYEDESEIEMFGLQKQYEVRWISPEKLVLAYQQNEALPAEELVYTEH